MKTPKKLMALVLMGALTVSSVAAVPATAKTFNDVPSNHWAYIVINEMSNAGIMIGTGTGIFSPNSILTRAEYTAILLNLAPDKSNGDLYKYQLNDVKDDDWFADAAEWGVSNGIIKEIEGNFKPNDPVTRELMAEMTYRYILKYVPDYLEIDVSSAGYSDESTFSDRYAQAINVLTNNNLLAGRGNNTFEPQGTLTRAEAAAMASRILDVEDESGITDPEEPENPPTDPEDPENPPTDPEDPETPPTDPEDPEQSWSLDGAPEWFLIGQPDYLSDDEWNELITYWSDKERPAEYPSKLSSSITTEEQAWRELNYYMGRLYTIMQQGLAHEGLEAGTVDLTKEEQAMLTMLNQARTLAGVPELKISPSLCKAAKIRAKEALISEAHKRPDGANCSTVLKDVGLVYNMLDGGNLVSYGENQTVWRNHSSYSAEYAFEQFLNSPLHKKNMENKIHEYIGIGYYSDGTSSAWIQAFGRVQ